jgi:plasmid stabilization system protein ParE
VRWRRHERLHVGGSGIGRTPGAIDVELAKAIDLIAAQPGIGARSDDRDLPGVRRIRLDRIGYHLYYSATSERIEILALWHVRRGSGPPL